LVRARPGANEPTRPADCRGSSNGAGQDNGNAHRMRESAIA
jgi:hypothetical protein